MTSHDEGIRAGFAEPGAAEALQRIAHALERIVPPAPPPPNFDAADAFVWHADKGALVPVVKVNRVDMALLRGIDQVRDILSDNTERFAKRFAANNALLWGARGMGKSSLVKAVHAEINRGLADWPGFRPLKLIEIHREDVESLPQLMALLRNVPHRFLIFCDDLSFDTEDTSYKSLKTVLEGGIEGRPANVILYATSNRRHLMPRDMIENERSTAINPGEAVEEKVSLSDRPLAWFPQMQPIRLHRHGLRLYRTFRVERGSRQDRGRSARMGDDARLAIGPYRLAIYSGSRRPRRQDDGIMFGAREEPPFCGADLGR